jgi:ribosomal RNA-processing protein 12
LEGDDSRSQRSAVTRDSKARTARASEWGHTKIFSDGGDSDDQQQQQQQQQRRGQQQGGPGSVKSGRSRGGGAGGVSFMEEGEEPMDLLEAGASRQLSRQAAGQRAAAARQSRGDGADQSLEHAADGRLVIEDEEAKGRAKALKRKRGREEGWLGDSDDSDMEDMKSFAGLSAAMKSVANAKSVRFAPSIAASLGGKSKAGSMGGKSVGGRSAQHSGDRYKPKKAGTGGDVKAGGSVEPYAYWQLDRKMLNRRRGKQAAASKGLAGVVRGAAAGVAKGGKARRSQQQSKRAKR